MKDALIVSLLSVLPRNRGASWMGAAARTRTSAWLTGLFVRAYGVDLSEATGTLRDYATLEALFTRRLREGARPVVSAAGAIVSPVDGRVALVATSVDGAVEIAPGRLLRVDELLGEPVDGERDVVVLYLSPTDYHRVHVPREGLATRWSYVPGTLWPVFPAAVRKVDGLFARNERTIVHVDTDVGPLAVVLVGAFGVGRIEVVVTDLLTNTAARAPRAEPLDPPHRLERGADLGAFHLGSTVILVAPPGVWTWSCRQGEPVRMGAAIGARTNG